MADTKTAPAADNATPTQRHGLFGGLAALREKANIQDRLVERFVRRRRRPPGPPIAMNPSR